MQTTIANLSNERLEQEIANVYYQAHQEDPKLRIYEGTEGSLLFGLWQEFDRRFEEGLIDPDPLTGNERDEDEDDAFVQRLYGN